VISILQKDIQLADDPVGIGDAIVYRKQIVDFIESLSDELGFLDIPGIEFYVSPFGEVSPAVIEPGLFIRVHIRFGYSSD